MADGNVIDSLSIEISANAEKAAKGLDQLSARLRSLSASVKNLSGAAQTLSVLSNSLLKMSNINVSGLSRAIDQIERLNKMDLKDTRIKLDVKLTGADEAERKIYAVQEAIKNIDTNALAKKFSDALGLKGVDARKIRDVYASSIEDLSKGGNGSGAFVDWLYALNTDGLRVASAVVKEQQQEMLTEYAEFLRYMKAHPISWVKGDADILGGEIFGGIKSFNEYVGGDSSFYQFFKKDGVEMSSAVTEEFSEMFPTIMAGAKAAGDQFEYLVNKVREAKEALSSVELTSLQGEESDRVWGTLVSQATNAAQDIKRVFDHEVGEAMLKSASYVPLNVKVNPETIENAIKTAIKQASAKHYDVPVRIRLDMTEFKQNINTVMSGVKVADLTSVTNGIQQFAQSAQTIGQTNFKDNGFRSFVNSIDKLSKVTINPSLVTGLKDIANGLGAFANVKNVSSGVTRLVTALAKLASTGGTIKQVTAELPNFSAAIRDVATKLSQLGGVSPDMTQFITAMGQLAGVGNKMPEAAQNMDAFGDAVKRTVQAIGGQNVNADVAQLVTALSQLSASMAQAGRNFSGGGGGNGGSGVSSFNSGFTLFKKILNEITKLANKAAHLIVSAFKKIGQGIATIVKGAVAKLEELKKSIMSLASSVASSAFGKIKSGLSGILNISEIQNATHSMYSLSDSIKVVIGSLLGMRGITGIFSWMKDAVSAGGDITEINHIIESVFEEDMVGYVNAWADNAIEKFGIASGAAKQYAGVLSSMFQSSGISKSDAGKMGMRLTELAGDLSAFYNIDTETAYQKLKSGMAGMVRPLRDLGIDLSVATLQEYALTQGITKSVTAMTQAEKVMLRYNYLLSVTEVQQGDFIRTSDRKIVA